MQNTDPLLLRYKSSPWVIKTAGKMMALASRTPASVVNPRITLSFWKNVSKLSDPATSPPTRMDPFMRCRTRRARIPPSGPSFRDKEPSPPPPPATSRASSVCTATATDSQICVVANPNWNVRLYAAAATGPSSA